MLIIGVGGCSNPLARQYEYDEQTYLEVDGSATVVVSASVASLVALRGLPLDPSPDARIETDDVRRVFEAAGCVVDRVSRPWRRAGRRFVQVQVSVEDVRKAAGCGPLAWSTYSFVVGESDAGESQITYKQTVGAPTGKVPEGVSWTGAELVVFKLHLPSKVIFHNVRLLENPQEAGSVGRGNILTWEQHLTTRLSGTPIAMEVITDADSILHQTMYLFAGAFAAAVLVLMTIIWLVIRRGRVRLKELRK
ncbi:MAG: heme exporter protein CcmD [Acidobacteria bacterium]|jgi:hypothetical protein|nr:heme exporter protein CcmD [Acidobacteriota bacterium]